MEVTGAGGAEATAESMQEIFEWKITNFSSLLLDQYSRHFFEDGDQKWVLEMHPRSLNGRRGNILSIALIYPPDQKGLGGVEYAIMLVNQSDFGTSIIRCGECNTLPKTSSALLYFLKLGDATASWSGFLKNDTMIFKVFMKKTVELHYRKSKFLVASGVSPKIPFVNSCAQESDRCHSEEIGDVMKRTDLGNLKNSAQGNDVGDWVQVEKEVYGEKEVKQSESEINSLREMADSVEDRESSLDARSVLDEMNTEFERKVKRHEEQVQRDVREMDAMRCDVRHERTIIASQSEELKKETSRLDHLREVLEPLKEKKLFTSAEALLSGRELEEKHIDTSKLARAREDFREDGAGRTDRIVEGGFRENTFLELPEKMEKHQLGYQMNGTCVDTDAKGSKQNIIGEEESMSYDWEKVGFSDKDSQTRTTSQVDSLDILGTRAAWFHDSEILGSQSAGYDSVAGLLMRQDHEQDCFDEGSKRDFEVSSVVSEPAYLCGKFGDGKTEARFQRKKKGFSLGLRAPSLGLSSKKLTSQENPGMGLFGKQRWGKKKQKDGGGDQVISLPSQQHKVLHSNIGGRGWIKGGGVWRSKHVRM